MGQFFTLRQIIILLLVTIAGVILSVIFHIPLVFGFLPGFILLVLMVRSKQVSIKRISEICFKGVNRTSGVIWILLLVSFLLPSWHLSGTIDQLVSVSLQIITPQHFFLISFIVSLVFSMTLGTSVGTLSAVGIPIMSSAMTIGLPIEIAAGAVISGAFVGDRTSPFSSAHQLLANTVELSGKEQFRAMLPTTIFAILLGFIFYGIFDFYIQEATTNLISVNWNEFSLATFLPPIILIVFVVLRLKIIYAFLGSITSAILLALIEKVSGSEIIGSLFYGIDGMGGGFVNMYLLLLFLALAGAYNGLIEEFGIIQSLLDRWLETSFSLIGDTVKAMVATLVISMIAANQTLPIILTGRSFLPHWTRRYSKGELARVMGDSTMLFPGMIPWSVLAIMCSTIIGVPLSSYLPYAIFLWMLPILSFAVSIYKHLSRKPYHYSKAS
ncbi:Na+/H+ antiporter NhaC family protein [Cytobacillus sp. S13-E01]|uniref:Na+/H+ antiporter NhaC family protein n=1 Tax=Cytobacillus sp. S13-E01 TaxID=3031326 RepID=UPI0023D803EE|nr:Na+/H+ antiporter NhaC family protein [Cytobacillus sp. S13-E01]MDF0726492.1 Na+/H+ antiporter NhaC family protein [Cytobacillus sp. S13-E01]